MRITIPCGPDDPAFLEHYLAARAGDEPATPTPSKRHRDTLAAVATDYLAWLGAQAEAGGMSPLTHRQRRSLLTRILEMPDPDGTPMGNLHVDLPPAAIVHIRDQWKSRTAQADAGTKALRAVYLWAVERGRASSNPAAAVVFIHRDRGGATPWSSADVRAFMARHGEGTTPRLWLLLALLTGARRGDLALLGRRHEQTHDGTLWLEWQPGKKGSSPVALPMAPQLIEATRGMSVIGATYLLGIMGAPFKTGDVLGNSVQVWTREAGLSGRSSHGVRKSLGGLLAEAGAGEHQIMSVLAHSSPKTAAIYTRSAKRARMAADAMRLLGGLRF